jgi:acyl-CoA thioester hydrolase
MSEPRSHEVQLSVAFHELDPLGVVWHGNYLRYFDIARFGLFSSAGLDLYRYQADQHIIFPLIKTSTKYIFPLVYGDRFVCKTTALSADVKIVLDFEIRRLPDAVVCTRGRGEQVGIQLPQRETLFEIPRDIRLALGF